MGLTWREAFVNENGCLSFVLNCVEYPTSANHSEYVNRHKHNAVIILGFLQNAPGGTVDELIDLLKIYEQKSGDMAETIEEFFK